MVQILPGLVNSLGTLGCTSCSPAWARLAKVPRVTIDCMGRTLSLYQGVLNWVLWRVLATRVLVLDSPFPCPPANDEAEVVGSRLRLCGCSVVRVRRYTLKSTNGIARRENRFLRRRYAKPCEGCVLNNYRCAGCCAVSHAPTIYNRFQIQS